MEISLLRKGKGQDEGERESEGDREEKGEGEGEGEGGDGIEAQYLLELKDRRDIARTYLPQTYQNTASNLFLLFKDQTNTFLFSISHFFSHHIFFSFGIIFLHFFDFYFF